tara:strand:+ start:132601 stop:133338 length:738 start_codon:yes stop_codon:yes gene_type:complete
MNRTIDLNCDVGEGISNESLVMPYISSCNIACGGHAGDELTITETIKLAQLHDVKIGAHPSFPDSANFGRKVMQMPSRALQQSIEAQINLVKQIAERLGVKLNHVKAHGALYNLAATDQELAQVLIDAMHNTMKNGYLYVPYKSLLHDMAIDNGINVKIEAFADRNYNANFTLVSRTELNAVIEDKHLVLEHLLRMVLDGKLKTIEGKNLDMHAETFCIHGDNSHAVEIVKYLVSELPKRGIEIS